MDKFYTKKEQLSVNTPPLGRGGEGEVYEVIKHKVYTSHVVKKLYKKERSPEKYKKIKKLIALGKPKLVSTNSIDFAWPIEVIYSSQDCNESDFLGYMLPLIGGVELTEFCVSNDDFFKNEPNKSKGYNRLALSNPQGFEYRVLVAGRVAELMAVFHQNDTFVWSDCKPENILIDKNLKVWFLDFDSCQIKDKNDTVIFKSSKMTPEYAPPERERKDEVKTSGWDDFSLAIVLYQLLIGLHPFSGSIKKEYSQAYDNEDMVMKGYYPFSSESYKFLRVPAPHQKLKSESRFKPLIPLFEQCFGKNLGLYSPEKRPTAITWQKTLRQVLIPKIKYFRLDGEMKNKYALPKTVVNLEWSVIHANKVEVYLNKEFKSGTPTGQLSHTVEGITEFQVKATSLFGDQVSETLKVYTQQLNIPKIEAILVPTPETLFVDALNVTPPTLNLPTFPNVSFPSINTKIELPKPVYAYSELNKAKKKNFITLFTSKIKEICYEIIN